MKGKEKWGLHDRQCFAFSPSNVFGFTYHWFIGNRRQWSFGIFITGQACQNFHFQCWPGEWFCLLQCESSPAALHCIGAAGTWCRSLATSGERLSGLWAGPAISLSLVPRSCNARQQLESDLCHGLFACDCCFWDIKLSFFSYCWMTELLPFHFSISLCPKLSKLLLRCA